MAGKTTTVTEDPAALAAKAAKDAAAKAAQQPINPFGPQVDNTAANPWAQHQARMAAGGQAPVMPPAPVPAGAVQPDLNLANDPFGIIPKGANQAPNPNALADAFKVQGANAERLMTMAKDRRVNPNTGTTSLGRRNMDGSYEDPFAPKGMDWINAYGPGRQDSIDRKARLDNQSIATRDAAGGAVAALKAQQEASGQRGPADNAPSRPSYQNQVVQTPGSDVRVAYNGQGMPVGFSGASTSTWMPTSGAGNGGYSPAEQAALRSTANQLASDQSVSPWGGGSTMPTGAAGAPPNSVPPPAAAPPPTAPPTLPPMPPQAADMAQNATDSFTPPLSPPVSMDGFNQDMNQFRQGAGQAFTPPPAPMSDPFTGQPQNPDMLSPEFAQMLNVLTNKVTQERGNTTVGQMSGGSTNPLKAITHWPSVPNAAVTEAAKNFPAYDWSMASGPQANFQRIQANLNDLIKQKKIELTPKPNQAQFDRSTPGSDRFRYQIRPQTAVEAAAAKIYGNR
jgi:hypothetical protein